MIMQPISGKRVIAILVTLGLLAAAVVSRWYQSRDIVVESPNLVVMGTLARIHVRCRTESVGQEAIMAARKAIDDMDRLFSTYRDDSELAQVNRQAAQTPVAVPEEVYRLLERSCYYSRMSGGAFDITVTPLIRLWKQAGKTGQRPSPEEIAKAQDKVGYQKLVLREEGGQFLVSFAQEGMELNVDAIAKGYAVDRALEALKMEGVTGGLVDIGGEVACFGGHWRIGIQDPFASDNDNPLSQHPCWVIMLDDGAVATSGNYRRYVKIGEQHFSHILDPGTGQPADKVPSVTIIAPKTIDADALATALSVIGPEAGLKLIAMFDRTECMLVTGIPENPMLTRSPGFARYEQ